MEKGGMTVPDVSVAWHPSVARQERARGYLESTACLLGYI